MLCGEAFVWKCWILLACGVFSDVAIVAIFGSSKWYRWRQLDVLFESMSNKLVIDLWSRSGLTSILEWKPNLARRIEEVVVMMKSGIALWLGKRMPRPPLLVWMWLIYLEMVGMLGRPSNPLLGIV